MKNISQNDLEELLNLIYRIQGEIKTFSHVSQHLPKSLTDNVDVFQHQLNDEHHRREDEF